MTQVYRTIAANSEGTYKEKGSKFIAYAKPINSLDEVQDYLQTIKSQHPKARHYCYGYVLGIDGTESRAYDDGEPRHSAGDPILGQIRSFNLTNVLVVVVRYFGGTKLGVGGLVNAYREATKGALEVAQIIVKEPFENWQLVFQYSETGKVMRLIKESNLVITDQSFEETSKLTIQVPASKINYFGEKARKIPGLRISNAQ